jgi:hypothetical protein
MKYYTVYQITNLVDNKIYIGKHETYDLNDSYMGSGKHLKRSQKKHGLENFKKEILFIFESEEEMNAKEAELVDQEFCNRQDTYNICYGGKGGFGYINDNGLNLYGKNGTDGYGAENLRESSKRHRERMSWDKEYATKIGSSISTSLFEHYASNGGIGTFRGKFHTEETKRKIGSKNSVSQSGSRNSQYGKPRSEETKEKIRQALLNRKKNNNSSD